MAGVLSALTPGIARAEDAAFGSYATVVGEPDSTMGTVSRVWYPGAGTVTVRGGVDGNSVTVDLAGGTVKGTQGGNESLRFTAPAGQKLALGTYTARQRYEVDYRGAALSVDGSGCPGNAYDGQFTVRDLASDLSRLWIVWELRCADRVPAMTGEIRHNQPIDPEITVAAAQVPWPKRFVGVPGPTRVVTVANPGPAGLTINAVEISDGAADFSLVPDSASCVNRVLAPAATCRVVIAFTPTAAGPRTGALSVSDTAASRTQTVELTGSAAPGHTSFALYDQGGDYGTVGRYQTYTPSESAISWTGTPTELILTNTVGTIRDANVKDRWRVTFRSGGGTPLQLGRYEDETITSGGAVPDIVVAGNGKICPNSTGAFTIRQIAFDAVGALTSFAATWEQHCSGRAPAIYGSVAYQADDPAARVPNSPPSAVRNLTAVGGQDSITLAWINPPEDDFREVVVSQTPSVGDTTVIYQGPATTLDVKPKPGYSYRFDVVPRNDVRAKGAGASVTVDRTVLSDSVAYGGITVASGKTFSFVGQLQRDVSPYDALAGRPVQVVLLSGGVPSTVVGQGITDENGRFAVSAKPAVSGEYAAIYRGGPNLLGTTGPAHQVIVIPSLTVKLDKTSAKLGSTFTMTVTVTPAQSGAPMQLQRLDGTKWVTVSKKTAGSKTTSFAVKPTAKGTKSYRVQKSSTSKYGAATGKTFTIKAT
jgi:hypothetical protein